MRDECRAISKTRVIMPSLADTMHCSPPTHGDLSELAREDAEWNAGRWAERAMVYRRDGQAVAVLAQPYTLSTEDLAGILDVCKRHRLQVDISMRSEWNPGQTLGVLFWRVELNPFVPPHLLP